jgi:hypothetical protein
MVARGSPGRQSPRRGSIFIGLWNQRSLASALIFGARADSNYVAALIASDRLHGR